MVISTPGGMLRGVRPSLDGRVVVAEKLRRAAAPAVCWKAGTRKPGSVTTEEDEEEATASRTLLRLGANIVVSVVVVVGGVTGRRRDAEPELAKRRGAPVRRFWQSQGQHRVNGSRPGGGMNRVDLRRAPKNVSDLTRHSNAASDWLQIHQG